jgi:hypothetical protein
MLADCPQAVSAVKAIAIAASQGQKIYTITSKNAATALPQLTVSRTVAAEIKNALAAGKEVTVHEKAINAHGFSGVGYIIVDPETGAGAYLIEGGGSGALLLFTAGIITFYLASMISLTGIGLIIGSAAFALGFFFIAAGIALLSGDKELCKDILVNAAAGFLGVLAAVGFAQGIYAGWGVIFEDQIVADIIIGITTAISVSQADRMYPLFRICGA